VPVADAEPCPVSTCTVEILSSGLFSADALAASHPEFVFWISTSDRVVRRTSKVSLQTIDLDVGPAPYTPFAIAADATTAYWSDSRTSGAILARLAEGGGAPAELVSGQDFALFVAVDDQHVYWTNDGGLVLRADKNGQGVRMVAASQGGDGPAGGLALDDERVYFADTGGGHVYSIVKDGDGQLTTVSANQGAPLGVAVDETYAYWTNSEADEVKRRTHAGGEVQLVASGQSGASFIVNGPRHVYWTNRLDGRVMSADKASLEVRQIASGQDGPFAIALDGDALYWVNQAGSNRLLRTYPCACR
jgi:hypothetical protein